MQASHIFCLPARYEAFGVANAEAAAAGARIVTTGVDGIPEVLDLSKAWVAKPDDVASLSETLISCMNEPTETTMPKLESQRQHVVRNLGRTKTLRRMHKLLNDVAANKI